jgi:hypothetical protein
MQSAVSLNTNWIYTMSTFRRIAPWFILGPITGLLAEGVYRNIRASNPGLAAMYAVAGLFSAYDLAIYGGAALLTLQEWFL